MAIRTPPRTPTPPLERPRRPRRLIVALVLGLLVAAGVLVGIVASQGDDRPESGAVASGGDRTPATAAPQPPETEEQKIVDTYLAFSKAEFAAQQVPDPDSPLLGAYAKDPQLSASVDAIRQLKERGLAFQPPANSIRRETVTVDSIEGDRALITICSVGDSDLVNAATREPLYPGTSGSETTRFKGELTREPGGVWKLSGLKREQRWSGVAGCAVRQ